MRHRWAWNRIHAARASSFLLMACSWGPFSCDQVIEHGLEARVGAAHGRDAEALARRDRVELLEEGPDRLGLDREAVLGLDGAADLDREHLVAADQRARQLARAPGG